jgi:hypothetical protein
MTGAEISSVAGLRRKVKEEVLWLGAFLRQEDFWRNQRAIFIGKIIIKSKSYRKMED